MKYWIVKPTDTEHKVIITCPNCDEWYEIPNSPLELKCYRYCPWCGHPLFLRKEDKNEKH